MIMWLMSIRSESFRAGRRRQSVPKWRNWQTRKIQDLVA